MLKVNTFLKVMSFASTYKKWTTPKEIVEQKQADIAKASADKAFADEQLNAQWHTWLQNPCTSKLMQELTVVKETLTRQAKQEALAGTNPSATLIKVDTIDKVIAYATTRKSIL